MRQGSLTQAPRQVARFGANVMPLCGQGFIPYYKFSELATQPQFRLSVPVGGVATFLNSSPILKAPVFREQFTISGVTRDGTGTAISNCEVDLFKTAEDELVARTVSDGAGNFTFSLGQNAGFFYLRAYKPGSPDIAGTTVNTLVAV